MKSDQVVVVKLFDSVQMKKKTSGNYDTNAIFQIIDKIIILVLENIDTDLTLMM